MCSFLWRPHISDSSTEIGSSCSVTQHESLKQAAASQPAGWKIRLVLENRIKHPFEESLLSEVADITQCKLIVQKVFTWLFTTFISWSTFFSDGVMEVCWSISQLPVGQVRPGPLQNALQVGHWDTYSLCRLPKSFALNFLWQKKVFNWYDEKVWHTLFKNAKKLRAAVCFFRLKTFWNEDLFPHIALMEILEWATVCFFSFWLISRRSTCVRAFFSPLTTQKDTLLRIWPL